MGGKTGTTTQQVQIPPEVLARYNSVNQRAQDVASTPFQNYSTEASGFVAPINQQQQAGIANINQAANMTQPYFGTATQYLQQGQQAAQPYYDYATRQLMSSANEGISQTRSAQDPMTAGMQQAQGLQGSALDQYRAAVAGAQPYNAAATQAVTGGVQAAQPMNIAAARNIAGAQAGAQPYQDLATAYGLAGAQAVSPGQLGSEQINRYMSPYMQSVVQSTLAPLRQQQQQEQSTLVGNQIAQGAFGGDRGRIAQANLARQQEMATAQTTAGLLQSGYGQALQTAQQQQGLGLSAEQANRAAQQQAAQQMLGIGAQGFGQGMTTAQQQAALGQQMFGQGLGAGQALGNIGQQQYGQLSGTGQNLAALGQQGFGQGLAQSQQQAALAQQLYGMGAGSAQQAAALGQGQFGMGATTAQQLAGLGTGAQAAALQGAQAQLGAGTLQQQTEQAGKQALYNQFLQQQGYPFQVAQFLANVAMGTGALSGSGQVTTQPMPFLSDRRAKEDIKHIGKTYDGQPIYSFKYKGDNRTQIGLMAQDVEKKHPEAVGLAGHLKTVDYDKATEHAANRGHFYQGGLVADSEGGAVLPSEMRHGYANGMAVSQSDIAALIEAQRQALGLYGGEAHPGLGSGLGSTPGASRNVPAPSLATPSLVTPGPAPSLQDNSAEAMRAVEDIAGAYEKYKKKEKPESTSKTAPTSYQVDEDEDSAYRGGLIRGHYAFGGDPSDDDKSKDTPTPGLGATDDKAVPTQIPGLAEAAKDTSSKPTLQKPSHVDQPQDNTLQTIGTIAGIAAMFMSDKRLKEDIEDVGETFDGQKIYRYRYKGDPAVRMGLMAQDVEHHHPEAVGLAGGYKTVDYGKATKEAAERGHFYGGGLARPAYPFGGTAETPENQQTIRGEIVRQPEPAPAPVRKRLSPAASNEERTSPAVELGLSDEPLGTGGLRRAGLGAMPILRAENEPLTDVSPSMEYEPQGLGALDDTVRSQVKNLKYEPNAIGRYFQDLKAGKEEAVIPLLKGVGAMLSGPSYTWGQAIGKGILGGASAYQPTRQAILERGQTETETGRLGALTKQTEAETLRSGAGTQFAQAQTLNELQKNAPPNMQVVVGAGDDPTKTFKTLDGNVYHYEPKATFIQTRGPKESVSTDTLNPYAVKQIDSDHIRNSQGLATQADQQLSSKIMEDVSTAAQNARQDRQLQLSAASMVAKSSETGPFSTGPTAPWFKSVLGKVSDIANRLGLTDLARTINDPSQVNDPRTIMDVIEKIAAQTGFRNASQADQNSIAGLKNGLTAAISSTNPKATNAYLVATSIVNDAAAFDEWEFDNNYRRYAEAKYPGQPAYYAQNMRRAFNQDPRFSTSQYNTQTQALADFLATHSPEVVNDFFSGRVSARDINEYFANPKYKFNNGKGVTDMAKFFTYGAQ